MFPAAITIRQPFATLTMHRMKHYETRSWRIDHELPAAILIHSSRTTKKSDFLPEVQIDRRKQLKFPLGMILGVAIVSAQYHTRGLEVSPQERALGDFGPARFAWHIAAVYPFPRPVPCPGHIALWRVPAHIRPAVLDQIDQTKADWLIDRIPGRRALVIAGRPIHPANPYGDDTLLIADRLPGAMLNAPRVSTTTADWINPFAHAS